ncbi:MAG: DUF5615 family PIN-like protein [Thiohalomonadaceae bacterium]
MSYLVDAKLPYRWDVWQGSDFLHVYDFGDDLNDRGIWSYAQQNHLIIVTKDSDFSDWVLLSEPPPKMVHFRVGNLRLRDFKLLVKQCWPVLRAKLEHHRLVIVFPDRIESMS